VEPFFRKQKKAREEELKKNEGAILKFVKIASGKETEEVSSHSKSLPQVATEEEEVYLEQNNNEVIIERSQPMNETLSNKDKTDDIYYSHNDVATWPEVTHNMRVEMIKLGPEGF